MRTRQLTGHAVPGLSAPQSPMRLAAPCMIAASLLSVQTLRHVPPPGQAKDGRPEMNRERAEEKWGDTAPSTVWIEAQPRSLWACFDGCHMPECAMSSDGDAKTIDNSAGVAERCWVAAVEVRPGGAPAAAYRGAG